MSKKAEAFLQFLQAASSLAKQGVKKSEILKFAKLQFGKVTDEITKAVDNIFEKSPLEKILDRRKAAKKSIEERKVLDMDGNVIDPNQPIIGGKQDKGITTLKTEFTPEQAAEDIFPSGDYKYDMDMAAESYVENNPEMFKNMLYEDLDQKTQMEVYEKVSKVISRKNAEKIKAKKNNPEPKPKGFQLNVEKFVQDFPVSKEEALRISKLPTEEQEKIIKTYLDEDFSQQITLMDFEPPKDRKPNATGGRAGYYGGGQAMIEPDLSDIGHGSDSLMARTRITAPGSQATTSTGLNYLLGEDNDNIRVPFNEGLLVPPKKPYVEEPYTTEMFEDESMTLLKGMYGTGPDSNEFLYNEMIKKGNILRNQGVERETVIEIIRNNKDKINAFLETQTTTPKSLKGLADGGITELRQGYVGGGGVNLARRGFLKVLAGTGAAVAAFKTGALKLLGKSTTKAAPKLFTAAEGSGAPAWFEGMVNKVLSDGVDITKKAATMDGQTVKSLDTPTGKVDVTIDRTGNIDVNYMGDNTAMGEGVDMRYVVGQADETTKVKPFDEFEAVESVPEFQGGNYADGPDLGFGENATGEVKNLYSDVSELQALGGDKRLINDISVTLQKKKTLKRMDENPQEFAQDMDPDVYYDD